MCTMTASSRNRSRSAIAVRLTRLVLLAAMVLCCWLPNWAGTQTFLQTYPLTADGSFRLENINGSVRVEGWERDEVEVRAIKTSVSDPRDADRVKIEVSTQPGAVVVHTRYPQGTGVEVAVEYVVHVPYRALLGAVETVNGSVVVRGVEGGGDLRSVNGDVQVLDSSGRFSAKTTNGNLRLQLRQLVDGDPMNFETVNGSVVLGLPSNAHADLKILSMNGEFSSELPVTSTMGSPAARAFRARLGSGSGGGQISVRTVNGTIRLVVERPGV